VILVFEMITVLAKGEPEIKVSLPPQHIMPGNFLSAIRLRFSEAWILAKKQRLRLFVVASACLVLGGALFGLSYWQGERSARQQVNRLAGQGFNRPHPMMPPGLSSPAITTPEMKEFAQNRQTLMQKMADLRRQNPGTNGALDPKLFAQFREQNKTLLDRQLQLSRIIAQQQAQPPLPEPPPRQMPSSASPQLRAYLTTRDQLMRDEIAFLNQHRTDDPATRQAAMQQWRQQNAARFQQLQQQALAVVQTTRLNTTTTPTNANK